MASAAALLGLMSWNRTPQSHGACFGVSPRAAQFKGLGLHGVRPREYLLDIRSACPAVDDTSRRLAGDFQKFL